MPLNVVLVSSDFPPDPGGIATHVYALACQLVLEGHHVTVLHAQKDAQLNRDYAVNGTEAGAEYVALHPRRFRGRTSFGRSVRRTVVVAKEIRRARRRTTSGMVRNDEFVVHFHDLLNTTVASVLVGGRKVWTNHSSQFYELKGLRLLLAQWLTRVDRAIAPSSELAIMTWKRLHIPAVFVPNGVNAATFDPAIAEPDDDEFKVFVPRRMVHKNGIDIAVRAGAALRRPVHHNGWIFMFPETGADPAYAEAINELLAHLPDHVSVQLLGAVSPSTMPNLYHQSDMAVIPSRIEAVSISALEAMAAGKPLVVTAVGGLIDAFRECPYVALVPPEDPLSLARAIERIESMDQGDLDSLSECSVEWVRSNFSWESVCASTVAEYERDDKA